jgi:glucokinase
VKTPIVGVDVGGTNTDVCLFDEEILARASLPTDPRGGDAVATRVAEAINLALRLAEPVPILAAIGIGIPGQVDPTGTVRHAVNLGIESQGYPIGPVLSKRFGVMVAVENDVRVGALGAFQQLSASHPDLRDLVYLGVGTGIAAGVVIDGVLHAGRRGLAGEIGHLPVTDQGPVCRCGRSGCLEAVVAGPAIRRRWPAGAGDLFERASQGEPEAERVAEQVAQHLARAVLSLSASYDPDLVVVGGGVGSAHPHLDKLLAGALDDLAAQSSLTGALISPERVVVLSPEMPVGTLGAVALAAAALNNQVSESMEHSKGGEK